MLDVEHPIAQFTLHHKGSLTGGLKNKRKFQTFSSRSVRGHLWEVVAYKRFETYSDLYLCHSIRAVSHDRGSLDCDLSGCNQHVRRDFFYAGINSPIHTISSCQKRDIFEKKHAGNAHGVFQVKITGFSTSVHQRFSSFNTRPARLDSRHFQVSDFKLPRSNIKGVSHRMQQPWISLRFPQWIGRHLETSTRDSSFSSKNAVLFSMGRSQIRQKVKRRGYSCCGPATKD